MTVRRLRNFMAILAAFTLLIGVCVSKADTIDSREATAWNRALDLAKATPQERASWKRPRVLYLGVTAYKAVPAHDDCGTLPGTVCAVRMCGVTVPFLTPAGGNESSLTAGTYVAVFMLPTEDQYLPNLLTHEYLHTVWVRRVGDKAFFQANPDSEQYVESLIDATCPNVD